MSRRTTDSEAKYPAIEGEATALLWALREVQIVFDESCYTTNRQVKLAVEQLPLLLHPNPELWKELSVVCGRYAFAVVWPLAQRLLFVDEKKFFLKTGYVSYCPQVKSCRLHPTPSARHA